MRKQIVMELYSALKYIKSKKVIHRNLNLKNIIMDKATMKPRVTGFDQSVFFGRIPLSGYFPLPGYVAPEIFY